MASMRRLSPEELNKQLEKLLEDVASDEQIFDWVEVQGSWSNFIQGCGAKLLHQGAFFKTLLFCYAVFILCDFLHQANLEELEMSSPPFLRALMTAVCKAAVKCKWLSIE